MSPGIIPESLPVWPQRGGRSLGEADGGVSKAEQDPSFPVQPTLALCSPALDHTTGFRPRSPAVASGPRADTVSFHRWPFT